MQKSQKGFTLIELVVVIVLLGILGVTALARFQDLSLEAQNAANSGIASELTSSSSINYAAATLGVAGATAINTAAENCPAVALALFATGVPAGYTILPVAATTFDCTALTSFACTVDSTANTADTPATAQVLCTP
jgi:MSHA pilin protein MshA